MNLLFLSLNHSKSKVKYKVNNPYIIRKQNIFLDRDITNQFIGIIMNAIITKFLF